jgi:hypothetical protein
VLVSEQAGSETGAPFYDKADFAEVSFSFFQERARQIGFNPPAGRGDFPEDLVHLRIEVRGARIYPREFKPLATALFNHHGLSRGQIFFGRPMSQLSSGNAFACHSANKVC